MSIAVLAIGVTVVGALYVLIGIALHHASKRIGITHGRLLAADQSLAGMRTLYSERLGLAGRPDQLLRVGAAIVPVEQKPFARAVHDSHTMQVAAECALVEAVYGVRPPYGILVLAGGSRREIPYTHALEQQLANVLTTMRQYLTTESEPGPNWVAHKCRSCGYRVQCWKTLDP